MSHTNDFTIVISDLTRQQADACLAGLQYHFSSFATGMREIKGYTGSKSPRYELVAITSTLRTLDNMALYCQGVCFGMTVQK